MKEYVTPKIEKAIGLHIGSITILHCVDRISNDFGLSKWRCQCDCGNIIELYGGNILQTYRNERLANAPMCPTCRAKAKTEKHRAVAEEFMKTHKFGMLQPIEPLYSISRINEGTGNWIVWWKCRCDCGNYCNAREDVLKRTNAIHSCGCRDRGENIGTYKHGLSQTRIYVEYINMIRRCYRETDSMYKEYGGRGIRVCSEWYDPNDFNKGLFAFVSWALEHGYHDPLPGENPRIDGLTIERIDVDGDYCPDNCTWIPAKDQAKNQRKSRRVNFEGELVNITNVRKIIGMSQIYMDSRTADGWSNDAIVHSYLNPHLGIVKNRYGYHDKHGFLVLIPKIHKYPPEKNTLSAINV